MLATVKENDFWIKHGDV